MQLARSLGSLIAPDARFSAPSDVRLQGKDAVISYTSSWMRALPDAKITVTHEIVSAPWIVQETTFKGTTHKPAGGVTPCRNRGSSRPGGVCHRASAI